MPPETITALGIRRIISLIDSNTTPSKLSLGLGCIRGDLARIQPSELKTKAEAMFSTVTAASYFYERFPAKYPNILAAQLGKLADFLEASEAG